VNYCLQYIKHKMRQVENGKQAILTRLSRIQLKIKLTSITKQRQPASSNVAMSRIIAGSERHKQTAWNRRSWNRMF